MLSVVQWSLTNVKRKVTSLKSRFVLIKWGDYWPGQHPNQWDESRCSCLSLDRDRLAVYPTKPMLTSSPSYWRFTHLTFSRFVCSNMTTSFLSYAIWQVRCCRVSLECRQPELHPDTNLTWSLSGFSYLCRCVSQCFYVQPGGHLPGALQRPLQPTDLQVMADQIPRRQGHHCHLGGVLHPDVALPNF